jgi:hypothetical protein
MKRYITVLIFLVFLSISACVNTLDQTPTLAIKEPGLSESQSKVVSTNSTGTPIITSSPSPTPTLTATLLPTLGYKPQLWTTYSLANIGLSPPDPSISVFYIYDIEETENSVFWLASTYGLIRFDGDTWELVKSETGITNTAYVGESHNGEIWFTLSDGVYSLREEVIQIRMSFEDFGVDIFDVTGFSLSPNGQVWIALRDSIWFFDGDDWNIPESENELPFRLVGRLAIDQNRILYAWGKRTKKDSSEAASKGSVYGGLSYYDGSKWVYYDQKEQYGIPAADETSFFADPLIVDGQNHIWFYLWREGLFEYTEGKFILHVPYDIDFYHPITMKFDQQGTLWLGALGEGMQLYKYVPGSDGFQSIDDSFTLFIEEEDSGYLISRNEIEGILPFEHVSALYVDSKNDLWIATELGVYVYDIDMD